VSQWNQTFMIELLPT